MVSLFTTIFYQPILNLVLVIYNWLPGHDIGWTIIILTVLIKLLLYPLSKKSIQGQKSLQNLQPKLEAIKQKYKDNKEEQSRAMMELYKNEKVNPLSSCLPLLIQLPFFWAIFRVFRDDLLGKVLVLAYPFVHNPGTLNPIAFGFFDFSRPNIYLGILAGLAQFAQAKMMPMAKPQLKSDGSKDENMMAVMNKQMLYFMPILTVIICYRLPSGLAFYWFISTILTIVQQWWIFRQDKDVPSPETGSKVIEGEIIK